MMDVASDLLPPPQMIRVVDFELTGHDDPEKPDIIEVGWCDLVETKAGWESERPNSRLVRPTKPILVEAMAIHHLQDRDLMNAQARDAVLANVLPGPEVVAMAAHSAETEQANWPQVETPWICTYKLSLRAFPDAPRHSLQVLRYYLGLDLADTLAQPAHRGGPDAYVTAHLLARLLATGITVADAIQISAEPAILPRVTFGQHRGKRWRDMDTGFLYWVLDRDFHRDVLHTARKELDRREAEWDARNRARAASAPAADDGRPF